MKRVIILTIFFLFTTVKLFSQTIWVPLESEVYPFLERMSAKHIILLHDEVKPFSRMAIASYLSQIEKQKSELSDIDIKELAHYKRDFTELSNPVEQIEKWRLFSYTDSLFRFRVNPLAGYESNSIAGASGTRRWWGAYAFGTIDKWFGFSLNMSDNGEYGSHADLNKLFSPVTGASNLVVNNGVEYSDVRGSMNFSWGWGNVSIQKDYVNWGHGTFGQVILSSKAPSFPMIRFDLAPVEWIRFHYVHGWLNSMVVDSIGIYHRTDAVYSTDEQQFVKKYYVANLLSISPFTWLDFSIGNSLVYKGALRAEMFVPFMFFKYLDRDTGHGNIEDGNGAIFSDMVINYWKGYRFYYSLFLDVTEVRNLMKGDFHNTWYGLTLGAKKYDVFTPGLDITAEYTIISPWVYEHKDSTTTYKHINFNLGHWLGQNADQFRFQIDYKPLYNLKTSAYVERVRKGGLDDISIAYKDDVTMPFLYGKVRTETNIALNVRYEIIDDAFAKLSYRYSSITDDDQNRLPQYLLGNTHNFAISLYYGL